MRPLLPRRLPRRTEAATSDSFLEVAAVLLIDSGDRDGLLTLFSIRFPRRIHHYTDTEFLLVLRGTKIKDPILILGEAYAKCRVAAVQKEIATAVRHGFSGSGIRGNDDAKFVQDSMRWYEREKEHLILNIDYSRNAVGTLISYKDNPLFVRKPLAGKTAGSGVDEKVVPQHGR